MSRVLGRRVVALALAIKVAGLRQTAEKNSIVTSSLSRSCIATVENEDALSYSPTCSCTSQSSKTRMMGDQPSEEEQKNDNKHNTVPASAQPSTNNTSKSLDALQNSTDTKGTFEDGKGPIVPSKRKAAIKDEPSKAPRRSARGAQQSSIDPMKILRFLLSPKSTDLCRPKDETEDLKTRGDAIRVYSVSTFTPFEELISAVILSRPISHALGLRSIRTIFNDPWNFTTVRALRNAGSEGRRKALDEARTQHRQKTAEELGLLADALVEKLGDNEDDVGMERVRREGEYDAVKVRDRKHHGYTSWDVWGINVEKELEIIKSSVKGLGKTGIDIFRRRIQGVWPACYPFVDQKTSASLEKLGLPADAEGLEQLMAKHWEELNVENIEAIDEEEKKRKAFVRLLERAVGADLEGNVDDIKAQVV